MAKGGDTKPVWDLPDEDFDYMTEVKILWALVGVAIAPFVIAAGFAIGFAILEVLDPILAGDLPPLAQTIMVLAGALALWLVFAAIRFARKRAA